MAKNIQPTDQPNESPARPVRVVAIGGSAGAQEAFSDLLRQLRPDTGMAFIYIQHLSPTYESMLANIFSNFTGMPVFQAEEGMPVQPNVVYVVPPNRSIELLDGTLTLSPRRSRPVPHMPIDQFFSSLAEHQKEMAIGVLLSGANKDGSQGLRDIRAAGGITIVQDQSAAFQTMPRAAAAEGVVDLVLSPEGIAREIERLAQHAVDVDEIFKALPDDDGAADADDNLYAILQQVRKHTGVDFSHYKMTTVRRRIMRRVLLAKVPTLAAYAQQLMENPVEAHTLYADLLIHVTSFFRDPESMEFLKKTIFPRLLQGKGPRETLRIWVPACSTGEEPYSIAMVLLEALGDRGATTPIQIFATDLSESAIARARLGTYSAADVAGVSAKRLERFFTKVDDHYRIIKHIREMCVFAPHNVFRDPPFSRIDFISCCNLLIYLDSVLQRKVIATFHYALNPDGVLMLGRSETIGSPQHFTQLEKKYKVYARKNDATPRALFEMAHRLPDFSWSEKWPFGRSQPPRYRPTSLDLDKTVDSILLAQYIPATVVVNQDLEILQFRGSTGLYLEPSPGKASLNLLKMARPGLALELRNTVHKAIKTGQTVRKSGLEFKVKDQTFLVEIEVVPLKTDSEERLFLILFQESAPPAQSLLEPELARDQRIRELEEELATLREDMRSIIEEQEASNEELQSANEEIVSSNEELQSINEELETSKEEVESTNEELMTINQELQLRNEELAVANDYAEAVFTTIREAIIVLNSDLRVRSANKAFYDLFQLDAADTEGRLLFELDRQQWDIPQLRTLVQETMNLNRQYHGFELAHTFPSVGPKTLLINARKVVQRVHRQELLLLAIEDITEHRQAQHLIAEREAWMRNMADSAPVMIWVTDAQQQYTFFNRTWLDFTGLNDDQQLGQHWLDGVHADDRQAFLQLFASRFQERQPFHTEYRLRRYDGAYRWILHIGKPTYNAQGEFTGYIGTGTDIHLQKTMNEELEFRVRQRTEDLLQANAELERSNRELEQFAYIASHDMQEPLRKIQVYASRLQESRAALPEAAQHHLDRVEQLSGHMSQLMEDLASFWRLDRRENTTVATNLNAVLENVLRNFNYQISQAQAQIDLEPLPTLQADPVQMIQLFNNLLNNSLKFADRERRLHIRFSARQPTASTLKKHLPNGKPGQHTELVVMDNGIGFPPQYADRIFAIFQKLHQHDEFPGTGIGLALCRRIVENHHGAIFAESKAGMGTAIHVILPLKQPKGGGRP